MTDKVHEVTTVQESKKPSRFDRKKVWKWGAVAVFGTALAYTAYDKVAHRGSKTTHTVTETEETTES
jgi:hypothetical protein